METHRITIDGHPLECAAGTTILAAARSLGIAIPTLCHAEGCAPGVSCMVCVVRLAGADRLLPACATLVQDGQVIETAAPDVLESRRMALELLLSDHAGDCEGPCRIACPAFLEIPAMIRAAGEGRWDQAWSLAAEALILPETLGYICPSPCEKICRRGHHDGALAIRVLHREAARRGRQEGAGMPAPGAVSRSGRRVAVVGAGPAGLAAAHELARAGHACMLFDRNPEAGGALRSALDDAALPRAVLDAETRAILDLPGVTACWGAGLRDGAHLAELIAGFDAVLLAFGSNLELARRLGIQATDHGVQADRHTGRTPNPRVFAAGAAVSPMPRMAVRSVAAGVNAARSIQRLLDNLPDAPRQPAFNVRIKHLTAGEMEVLLQGASAAPRAVPDGNGALDGAVVRAEAGRCLHCDCRARHDCGLRRLGREYGASLHVFDGPRREVTADRSHPELVYESGKCIQCGLCVQLAERRGERRGLTFVKRGFAVRMAPALGRSLGDAIGRDAAEYAALCPTGALKPISS